MNYNVKIYKGSYSDKRLKIEFNKENVTFDELKSSILKRYGNLIKPESTNQQLKEYIRRAKTLDELTEHFNIMHRYSKNECSIHISWYN